MVFAHLPSYSVQYNPTKGLIEADERSRGRATRMIGDIFRYLQSFLEIIEIAVPQIFK